MLWWDARIKEARLKGRLDSLGVLKAVAYAVGCVTHAKNRIAAASTGNVSILFGSVVSFLDRFWTQFPEGLGKPEIRSLAREAADLMPGEDDEGPFEACEDYLIWGVSYAFSLATRTTYTTEAASEALSAADRAYWAIFSFYPERNQFYRTEEDIRQAEMSSEQCVEEIEFQIEFLAQLEEMRADLLNSATVLALLNNSM
ncbi:MAG: hypothetical protein L0Y72_17040 [Gemmataceae bacterium]|nr:hypothetical protein [Gemmataceae bacterium]MCI0740758.1 hypothetical protein [Gemmataceae bacterium]